MNKQELIDKLNKQLTTPSEGTDFDYGHDYGIQRAIYLAEDLDEPVIPQELEKPVVPQFVADWYEDHKGNFEIHLSGLCINFTCHRERLNDKLANWYEQLENKPIQTLVNMHQFGYEVEKEKLYLASFRDTDQYLGWNEQLGEWFMSCSPFTSGVEQTQETWEGVRIWNNPAFEIKEVEE